ncbi:MAG: protein kinase [Ktedonobacterales bacterium]|nr:protein kinase [Ktedonobacterales bacterium]
MAINRPPTLSVGTHLIDRYNIVAVVGQGGLGTVYQIRDIRVPNTFFALKETFDLSEGARKQFEAEARWLAQLAHPNIPHTRDYFEWNDRLYLVMDFISGENLEYKLIRNSHRPLGELDVVRWIQPICDALAYLHAQTPPIIHRDVKPANIIVTPNGRPALVDLGIAKEWLGEGDNRTDTFIRKAGTEGYAPPEQYAGKGTTGPHSDIYSLGATMYHLLTGQVPTSAVERAALDHPLIAPRKLNPRLSPQVEAVIVRALAIRPGDRYANMRDMSGALGLAIQRSAPLAAQMHMSAPLASGTLRPGYPSAPPAQSIYPSAQSGYPPPAPPMPPGIELAPTLLRPQPVPQSMPRRLARKAIDRPRNRLPEPSPNSSAPNGYGANGSLPGASMGTPPRQRSVRTKPPRSFPGTSMLVIAALLLVIGGIILGTHDYWSTFINR